MVHTVNCFCNKLTTIELKTKISLTIDKKEVWLPSNTAHLAIKSLTNSNQFVRGHKNIFLEESFLDQEIYHPLYLFPCENAVELTSELVNSFEKPINLIVPDGTWRQAKKVQRRERFLSSIQAVKITPKTKTIYPLRRQKYEFGLCTHEAIAFALEIIEGKEAKDVLMENLKIFIDAHLVFREIFDKPEKKNLQKL